MAKGSVQEFEERFGIDPSALQARRVLIIVENLPVPFDRRVWQEARTLHAAGAEVSVICPMAGEWTAPYEVIDGIHIYRHPLDADGGGARAYLREYAQALYWQTRLAWRVWRERGFDTIQGCNPPDLVFLVAAPFRLIGKRYIFDHHDLNPELYEAKFGKRGFFWRALRLVERLNFASASVVISTNDSYRRIALERGRKRPEDVFVVRSGPDLSRMRPVEPNPAWRGDGRFLVGYLGVMGEQEGIDLLLEAVRILVRERGRDDVRFVLVGGGTALADLRALSARMGLEGYVRFTGRASDADLLEVLSTADLCVNPDRVTPMNDLSTMNKILEYMAMGKPIVQFEVTEGRVSAGAASLYAAPNDPADLAAKIETLLEDPELRASMGRYGQARVARDLHWGASVAPLLNAYLRAAR
jgi:glycosyltransferase involved in cell wall biosynthesis